MDSALPREKTNLPPKPPCNIVKGYDCKKKGNDFFNRNDRALLHNNFTMSTWLLLGAVFQSLLLLLPVRPSYAIAPAAILLGYRLLDNLSMCFGLKQNAYIEGVTEGKFTALYPSSSNGETKYESGNVCVILLTARCNHPLGLFAPGFKDLADHFKALIFDLDANAPSNGFLGGTSYVNVCDRSTRGELMEIMYFKSHEDLEAFAHGEMHRKAWVWWNTGVREGKYKHIGIGHEVFEVPRAKWETVYVNYHPSNFGSTMHAVQDENGGQRWMSPLVDARRGRFRTGVGRMGTSTMGDENEKYGDDPYTEV